MKYAKKVDVNQPGIVKALRTIPGVSVEVDHDDILVGYKGRTYWYEIKSLKEIKVDGTVKDSALRDSQKRILKTFLGHYRIVWSVDQILNEIIKEK